MNAVLLLSYRRPPVLPDAESRSMFEIAADKARLAAIGFADGTEAIIGVTFVGLTEIEQRKALASFPGARRCYIAQN